MGSFYARVRLRTDRMNCSYNSIHRSPTGPGGELDWQLGDGMWNEKQPKAGRPLDDRREY